MKLLELLAFGIILFGVLLPLDFGPYDLATRIALGWTLGSLSVDAFVETFGSKDG